MTFDAADGLAVAGDDEREEAPAVREQLGSKGDAMGVFGADRSTISSRVVWGRAITFHADESQAQTGGRAGGGYAGAADENRSG